MPVLHQNMLQMGQPGRLARPLAVQPGIAIGGRGVRLIAAFLAVKVALAIATRRRWLAAAVFRAKACWPTPRSACRRPRNARPTAERSEERRVGKGVDLG